jgi:hypothetical protein
MPFIQASCLSFMIEDRQTKRSKMIFFSLNQNGILVIVTSEIRPVGFGLELCVNEIHSVT